MFSVVSTPPCDTFISVPSNEYEKYNENFIRFIELVNGLHRKAHQVRGLNSYILHIVLKMYAILSL